ncbi:cupin domain-containing protein [Robertkochia solimangrovi]|uniref:cupin domain-containing protein n=1 Tax=Robertkochia solimangrovi TaxID=2213046 RepID=UPI00117CA056|nr:cupin domain-containing protein [Robertkochia solimangrovi]TRZ43191.1 cupin domain-containing protein [Robertkochia solimangrovi]
MEKRSEAFFSKKQEWEKVDDGVKRQIMGYDDSIMLVKVAFEEGAIGYAHKHPHAQVSYVEDGEFEVTIGDETKTLVAGDSFYATPDTMHGVICKKAGMLVDVFSPIREDFIK